MYFMKDIYLTSTFTNQWNVAFNPVIGEALEKKGFTCYLPHRDTNQQAPLEEKFESNMVAMRNASIILAIAMNESPNFGAEVGYMHGIGRPIIALTSNEHAIPLMCDKMMQAVIRVENLDDVESYIDTLAEKLRAVLG
jgi:nucleoside 2-deoxyribosyltransferase